MRLYRALYGCTDPLHFTSDFIRTTPDGYISELASKLCAHRDPPPGISQRLGLGYGSSNIQTSE